LVRRSIRSEVNSRRSCPLPIATCIAACGALLFAGGCQAPGPHLPAPPLDPASLTAQYPTVEFSGARTLADFQNPAEAHWFNVARAVSDVDLSSIAAGAATSAPSVSPRVASDRRRPAQPVVAVPPGGPDEARSLKFDLTSAADRLVCELQRAASDGAPRDWSDFGALLLRIWGPPDGADAVLLIRSGGIAGFGEATFPLHLTAGWNLITVDLDALSRDRERHDMRQLEISPVIGSKLATFYLDDLVLADRTHWFTDQDGEPGELYAYVRGPRAFVGVPGGFELDFAEGAISAWYATGPENLAGRGGLGPWPVFIADDWSGRAEDLRRGLTIAGPVERGSRPAAGQKIVESSPARVVLEGSRELSPGRIATGAVGPAKMPRCVARYAIYPDGRVFVQTDLEAESSVWPTGRLGFILSLNSGSNFSLAERPPATPEHIPASFAFFGRTLPAVNLLWTPHLAGIMRWRRFLPETGHEPSLMLAGEMPAQPAMSTTQLLWFCPAALDARQAEEVASDYQEPLALRPDAGTVVTDTPGDLNHDGYNESEGCYELAPQRGRLRFLFDPGSVPRQTPLFRIHTAANAQCWVYSNGQALPAIGRDAAGRILFTLPGTIRSPRLIEIYTLAESP
jgi:hypothetical protein